MYTQIVRIIMRGTAKKEDLFKIPNILCYIRILLVPLFIYLFLSEYYWQSALVVITATATDVLDGYIARHFNMITDWGKFIDPVADKLMQFSMLVVTIFKIKWVLILVITFALKEIILLVVGLYIYHKDYNLNGANWAGKLCTVVMDTVLLVFIAFDGIPETVAILLISVVIVFMITSFVVYLRDYIKLYNTHIKKEEV